MDVDDKLNENRKLSMAEILYKKASAEYANRDNNKLSRLGYKK